MRGRITLGVATCILWLGSLYSPGTEKLAQYVVYDTELDSLITLYHDVDTAGKVVDLCRLFNKSSWDSIIVVRSYLPRSVFNEIDFCGQEAAEDSMRHVSHVDWLRGLVFVKNGCVTSYSVIRSLIEFDKVAGLRDILIPVLPRSSCKVRILGSPPYEGIRTLYFFPLILSKDDMEYKRKSDEYSRTHPTDSLLRDL